MAFSINRLLLLLLSFVLLLALVLWSVWPARQDQSLRVPAAPPLEPREIVLYFVDPAGVSLVSEERQIAGCNEERQCIAQTLDSLAKGSKTLQALIPSSTRVLAVDVDGNLARINFSRDLVNRHPGGTLSELLTVYGLANTLTVNFPTLERLQILIEGQIQATLKGHVDISRPVKADFSYSRIAESRERDLAGSVVNHSAAAAGQN